MWWHLVEAYLLLGAVLTPFVGHIIYKMGR